MFQTLNPHSPQGGQNGFSHEHIVAKTGGSIVSGGAVASLRPVRIAIPPSPPTIYGMTFGNSRVTVYFNAPTNNGSSPITSYKVTSSPGGIIVTGKASPLTVTGLTNGVPYRFSVVATSSDGSSAPTVSSSVTPADRPGAPTVVSVVDGNGSATVSFTAPTYTGGALITSYQVVASSSIVGGGGKTVLGTASPITVTGLTNGTYTFSVYARNKMGLSAAGTSTAVIIVTVPGAPTDVSARPAYENATVYFTAPANNGGSPITGYTLIANPGGLTANGPTSPLIVYGLTNGIPYTYSVYARNKMGFSAAGTSSTIILINAPGVPTAVSATTGNESATVTFNTPTNTGGAPIIDYTVTSSPGGFTATGAASPLIVAGLTNGTPYTFSVYARNRVGISNSAYTNAVIPATVPGPPTAVFVTAGSGFASVSFTAPANNGGAPVTSYTVTSNVGGFKLTTSSSPISLFGLTNGTPYIFSIVATNSRGSSTPVVTDPVTPVDRPGVPTAVSATPGYGSATVYFTAPTYNGGAPITSYTVTSNPPGFTMTTPPVTSVTIVGLTRGTYYSFSVVATNSKGSSQIAYTNAVTPTGLPASPTAVSASPRNGSARVTFSHPTNTGGTPITSYTVTSSPGGFTASGAASPLIVTGLTNGTSYSFSVVATNINGPSIPSTASTTVTPATVPLAPTDVSVTVGDWETSVSFTAPTDNGGSPVIAYSVSATPVGDSTVTTTVTGTSSPITVTGLTSGTSYIFSVIAVNSIGASPPTSSGIVTPVFVDRITASLTTSLTEYQASANDAWIKITAAEYTALQSTVIGTTKAGTTDELINNPDAVHGQTNNLTLTTSLLVANRITTGTPAIPANTYLYAFAISWVTTVPTEGMRVYTNNIINSIIPGGYYQAGGVLPATTSSGMSYYVRKSVATTNGETDGILACFSGTRIDYPDAIGRLPGTNGYEASATAPPGSGGYIGTRILDGAGFTPMLSISYRQFDGAKVPAPNTGFAQAMSGVGAIVLQGLATPKKQWA